MFSYYRFGFYRFYQFLFSFFSFASFFKASSNGQKNSAIHSLTLWGSSLCHLLLNAIQRT